MEHSGSSQMGTGGHGLQSILAAEMQSEVVSAVLEMGFDPDIVQNAVLQHLQEHGSGFTSAHELVVTVLELIVAVLDLEEEEEEGDDEEGEEEERMENGGDINTGTLDYTQEAVRLSTYLNFPDSVPVSASRMARAGFYYTGTGDRVVCFSCGGYVGGWEFGDTAMGKHKRLHPHCDFVNGRETRNKPQLVPPGLFPAPLPQTATRPPGLVTQAAPAGRDYTDFLSPAQQDKLRRRQAELNNNKDNNDKSDNNYRQPPAAVPPAGRGIDPREQYKSEQRRLDSYITWPAGAPIQPRELAKAGFFYTGSDDRVQCFCCQGILRNWETGDRAMNEHRRHFSACPFILNFNVGNIPIVDQDPNPPPSADSVKCFYCDGGLRNWDPGDDPWSEHAKWFSQCEFLRQQRGDNYVQGIQARLPNLQAQQQLQHMRPPSEAGTGQPAQSPQTSQSSLAAEMQSEVVSAVLEMGFDPNIVQNAVLQHLREHGSGFTSAHELVVTVLDQEEEERMDHSGLLQMGDEAGPAEVSRASGTEEPQPGTSEPMEPTAAASGEGNNLEQLQKELDKMKDERMCKICMDAEANIVFIPCAHLAVCANCAASVHECPICRSSVHRAVRTFMS